MNIDLSSSFTQIFDFIINVFRSVFHWLDTIYIFNSSVSLLDLNIAFAVMGLLFTALFAVVRSGVSYAHSERSDIDRAAARRNAVEKRAYEMKHPKKK